MKKEHSYNALKVLQIIRAILLIIMSCIVLSSVIVGHCAQAQDYFPMYQNENGHFSEELKQNIANRFDSTNNFVLVYYDYLNLNSGYGRYYYYYVLFPKNSNGMLYGEKYNNLYQWSIYFIGNVNFTQGSFWTDRRYPNNIEGVTSNNLAGSWFQGLPSSNYNTEKDFVSNFTIYTNNTSSKQLVLIYDDGVSIPDGDTAREDMEKPQISDYIPNWTNRPTFDGSSVENALQSVYNGIVWLGDNIKDTITGVGEFIGDTMRWAIQKIINTVRDVFEAVQGKINEVKNGILTVADKIQSTFDYISQPLQTTQVVTAIQGTDIHTDIVSVVNLSNTAFGIFGTVDEPQNFTIPLNLTSISILHQTHAFNIDLSWITDARPYIRAFMWCIVTFGLLYSIIIGIPSMIKDSK